MEARRETAYSHAKGNCDDKKVEVIIAGIGIASVYSPAEYNEMNI